jgi:hypothetical protein
MHGRRSCEPCERASERRCGRPVACGAEVPPSLQEDVPPAPPQLTSLPAPVQAARRRSVGGKVGGGAVRELARKVGGPLKRTVDPASTLPTTACSQAGAPPQRHARCLLLPALRVRGPLTVGRRPRASGWRRTWGSTFVRAHGGGGRSRFDLGCRSGACNVPRKGARRRGACSAAQTGRPMGGRKGSLSADPPLSGGGARRACCALGAHGLTMCRLYRRGGSGPPRCRGP